MSQKMNNVINKYVLKEFVMKWSLNEFYTFDIWPAVNSSFSVKEIGWDLTLGFLMPDKF